MPRGLNLFPIRAPTQIKPKTNDNSSPQIDEAMISWEFCFLKFQRNWDNKNKTINYNAKGICRTKYLSFMLVVWCLRQSHTSSSSLSLLRVSPTHSSPSMRSNNKSSSSPVNNLWSGSGISVHLLVPCVLTDSPPTPPFTATYLVGQSKLSYDLHNVHL